jgi:hypothetical protein
MVIPSRRLRSWYLALRGLPLWYFRAATIDGFHPLATARALGVALRARYTPEEAFALGLLLPGTDAAAHRRHISTSRMVRIYNRLNPPAWRVVLDDKSIFYRLCAAAELPIPRLYGLFLRGRAGWSYAGAFPEGRAAWLRFFEEDCPGEFVIKPTLGRVGRGVRVLVRREDGFQENGTRVLGAGALYDELMTLGRYDTFVIQERLKNHPAFQELTGTEALQTARVHTLLEPGGKAKVLYACLRLISGSNFFDNFRKGTTGNLIAHIDIDSGTLRRAVTARYGKGFLPIEPGAEPRTEGFALPLWSESLALVRRVAPIFSPLRHVGWDVAITPRGPVLLEGNHTADAPNATFSMEQYLPPILEALGNEGPG